jgi:hypothetical protein
MSTCVYVVIWSRLLKPEWLLKVIQKQKHQTCDVTCMSRVIVIKGMGVVVWRICGGNFPWLQMLGTWLKRLKGCFKYKGHMIHGVNCFDNLGARMTIWGARMAIWGARRKLHNTPTQTTCYSEFATSEHYDESIVL